MYVLVECWCDRLPGVWPAHTFTCKTGARLELCMVIEGLSGFCDLMSTGMPAMLTGQAHL